MMIHHDLLLVLVLVSVVVVAVDELILVLLHWLPMHHLGLCVIPQYRLQRYDQSFVAH